MSSSTRAFLANRCAINRSENFGCSNRALTILALSICMMLHSVMVVTVAKRSGWPNKQPSPKKLPLSSRASTASFPNADTTDTLTLPC